MFRKARAGTGRDKAASHMDGMAAAPFLSFVVPSVGLERIFPGFCYEVAI